MRVELSELKCVRLLTKRGLTKKQAEGVVDMIAKTDIKNVYSSKEIDTMLPNTVKEALDEFREFRAEMRAENERHGADIRSENERHNAEQRAESERKIAEQRAEWRADSINARKEHQTMQKQMLQEMRSDRRLVITTIVTTGIAISGLFISTLALLTHLLIPHLS